AAPERKAPQRYQHGVKPCPRMERAATTATLRLLDIEGGGDAARLGHAHRAEVRATTSLATPACKGRPTGGGGCQRDAGVRVEGGTTRGATVDPRRRGGHRATARSFLADHQGKLREYKGGKDPAASRPGIERGGR